MNYCFLDLETTGLEHEKDSILEVSFIVTDENLQEISRVDEIIIPEKTPLIPFVTQLTGITPELVEAEGKQWSDMKNEVISKIGDATIIGHNIDFDIRFLQENGVALEKNKRIDTHELARILLPGDESFSLEAITQRFDLSHEDAHRAMSDVKACIGLWPILLEKLKELPREAIPNFEAFFKQTDWEAGKLFLEFCGQKDASQFVKETEERVSKKELPEINDEELSALEQEHTTFVPIGNTGESVRWLTSVAKKSTKKTLIVAPELSFFPNISQVPTPSVLFDPERHLEFFEKRGTMNDLETTFWLQCAVRHWLGHRGVSFFNLYLHQRDYWREVCIESVEHPIFQDIIHEREQQKTLVCTPAAWAELVDLPLIKDRWLFVSETEVFAEKLLFAESTTASLQPFLEKTETQFFVAGFVREVIEKELGRAISTFPERILLRSGKNYTEFADALRTISESFEEVAQWLENPESNLVRWVSYFPATGALTFSSWKPENWRNLQQKFNEQQAILCLRHNGGESNAFCRVFLGRQEGVFLEKEELQLHGKIVIPTGLVSSKSPEFTPFCAQMIAKLAEERDEKNWVATGFSSLATLKNVGLLLKENPPKNCVVLGEKLAGGDTKMIGQLRLQKQATLLLQKIQSPELEDLPFTTFVIQKFPFAPPQPLLNHVESEWVKKSGEKYIFFNNWTVPTITARLSRAAGQFGNIETVIVIDPAETSTWGKTVLKNAFPHFHTIK